MTKAKSDSGMSVAVASKSIKNQRLRVISHGNSNFFQLDQTIIGEEIFFLYNKKRDIKFLRKWEPLNIMTNIGELEIRMICLNNINEKL